MVTHAKSLACVLSLSVMMPAFAATPVLTEGFDRASSAGAIPPGWVCGVTGRGAPVWMVRNDATAPSKPNVLIQSGNGAFPWCVVNQASLRDGFVEVMLKPISGKEDQAGGVIWRWKDADNYYVARANALENNVSLYYMENGRRQTLKYADAPVSSGQWSTLRVKFSGRQIQVLLNGTPYIDFQDDRPEATGTVGVWTKADSVTAFDNFSFGDTGTAR